MNDRFLVKWKENRERIFRRDNSQPVKQESQENRPTTYLKPKNQAPIAPSNNQNQNGGYLEPVDHTANQSGYLEPLNKPVVKNNINNNNTSDYLQPNQENDSYIVSNSNNTSNNREIKDSYVDSSRYKPRYINSYQEPGKIAYINDDVVNELNQRFSKNQQTTTQFVEDYDDKESNSGYLAPRQSANMSSTSSTAPLIKNNRANGTKTKYAPPPPVQSNKNKFSLARPNNETDV